MLSRLGFGARFLSYEYELYLLFIREKADGIIIFFLQKYQASLFFYKITILYGVMLI